MTTSGFGSLHTGVSLNSVNLRTLSSTGQSSSRYKTPSNMQHDITIASSVTKVRWRPPAWAHQSDSSDINEVDPHDSMFAVATARLASAGGSGVISLWSTHRPFMPLSVVEGHLEGSVAGFVWMRTPRRKKDMFDLSKVSQTSAKAKAKASAGRKRSPKTDSSSSRTEEVVIQAGGGGDVGSVIDKQKEDEAKEDASGAIWQHVLSVGRDGKCILQSFARGDRPISRVPSSCFAIANLSPFQRGYGSLQVFSVQQDVPNSVGSDFQLTKLRQDVTTANAPGVFKEKPMEVKHSTTPTTSLMTTTSKRLPDKTPELHFNVLDQGPLDENGLPVDEENSDILCVAPEVVHLSRFANSYKFYPDTEHSSKVELCNYNADVAEDLRSYALSRMWRSIAEMLSGSGLDEIPSSVTSSIPDNVMAFAMLPTLKALLLERADAGDVQTCVAICEVFQIIQPENSTRIPGLEPNLVREWYLSYIDLLQQMCLFTAATYLIKHCSDPFIGALNQQSTT